MRPLVRSFIPASVLRNFRWRTQTIWRYRKQYFLVAFKTDHAVQRAIELVKLAIIEDEKHNYADAYKIYQNALDYFMLAFKCKPIFDQITIIPFSLRELTCSDEKNEKSKDLIKSKINEYLGRAEILKEHLGTERRGRNAIGVNGGDGATGPTGQLCVLHSILCFPSLTLQLQEHWG
jgi:hypothetical protein